MKKRYRIIITAIVLVIGFSLIVNSLIGLQNVNRDIDEARPYFEEGVSIIFGTCRDALNLEDYDILEICHEQLQKQLEYCSFYGNPPVCNDPIINEVELKIQSRLPEVNEAIDLSAIELLTYTNNKYGFSIDYPSNWVIDEDMPHSKFANYVVAFKDRPSYPEIFFSVNEEFMKDSSFDVSFGKYKNELGGEYTVKINSEQKIQLGTINAYELQYSTFIGSTECFDKEFVIDMESSFVPIISLSTCENEKYEKYLPLFEKIAYTFKPAILIP